MPRPAAIPTPDRGTRIPLDPVRLWLGAALVLQAFAGFLPATAVWGAGSLAQAPWPARVLWPGVALLLIWSPAAGVLGRRTAAWLGAAVLGHAVRACLILPLAAAPALWLLRDRGRLLGDGMLLCGLLDAGRQFHGFELLTFHLHAVLFALLGLTGTEQAHRLLAGTSVLAGVLYLCLAGALARRLASDPARRAFAWILMVLLPAGEIFLGYAESYAFLAVAGLAFAGALGLHYLRGSSLRAAAWALSAALALHLDALLLAPVLAAAALWPTRVPPAHGRNRAPGSGAGQMRRAAVRLAQVALPPLLGLAAALALLAARGQGPAALLAEATAPMSSGPGVLTPLGGRGGWLDWRHWKDAANLVLLLAPVPAILLLAWRHGAGPAERASGRRGRRLLAGGALWLAVLAALLHLKLGPPRDWDLLAFGAPLAAVAAFFHWRPRAVAGPVLGAVLVTSLALCLPWFWVNAGQERAHRRLLAAMADQPSFARALAHEDAAKLLRRQGRLAEAAVHYRACVEICPSHLRFHVARARLLLSADDPDGAMASLEAAMALDDQDGRVLALAAAAESARDRHPEALVPARRLAGRPEEEPESAALHGAIAERLGLLQEAAVAYRRALDLAPDRLDVLERLAGVALVGGDYGLAEKAFRTLLGRSPELPEAAFGLADALWLSCLEDGMDAMQDGVDGLRPVLARLHEAAALLERFGRAAGRDPVIEERQREIQAALARSRGEQLPAE